MSRFSNWYQTKSTEEYLKVLVAKHYCDSSNGPIEVNVGGTPEATGTWGDRRVAFRLAQWISAEFALQVDEWVEELLLTGSVNIGDEPKAEPKTQALPPAMSLKDYMEVSAAFDLLNDPMLRSLFQQRVAEELGGKTIAPNADRIVLVSVRATELGICQKLLGNGSQLGKYIVAKGFVSLGKVPHGKYESNSYKLTTELDAAILDYFQGAIVAA